MSEKDVTPQSLYAMPYEPDLDVGECIKRQYRESKKRELFERYAGEIYAVERLNYCLDPDEYKEWNDGEGCRSWAIKQAKALADAVLKAEEEM